MHYFVHVFNNEIKFESDWARIYFQFERFKQCCDLDFTKFTKTVCHIYNVKEKPIMFVSWLTGSLTLIITQTPPPPPSNLIFIFVTNILRQCAADTVCTQIKELQLAEAVQER